MSNTGPATTKQLPRLYVHGFFHSVQFDKFIFLLMISWIVSAAAWLYVEAEFLAGGSVMEEGGFIDRNYPYLIVYLLYFIVVFGVLSIGALGGRDSVRGCV